MMEVIVQDTVEAMGRAAAKKVASLLRAAIAERGAASMVISTGASQFSFFEALVKEDVEWGKVELFHLDEYLNLPESHPASFRRYIKERFLAFVPIETVHFVNGEQDPEATIAEFTKLLAHKTIDVGVIGFGENAHIAFNDPPADFDTEAPYRVVTLDHKCRMQQVGEGWFETFDDVPEQAMTMTVRQILKCRSIVSVVPHAVKADAVRRSLTERPNNHTPASILKTHPDWHLYLDPKSAAELFPV